MAKAPDKILSAYRRVSRDYPSFIALKKIKGKYYLYGQTTKVSPENKKQKTISKYLGRITEDGAFIKRLRISEEYKLETAKSIIEAHGGKIIFPESDNQETSTLTKEQKLNEIDQKILTILSMNARASAAFVSTQTGLSNTSVNNRIKQLEKRYGIEYIAEVDTEKLGYSRFLAFCKFLDKIPTINEIKSSVEKIPNVQLVATLGGNYDLFVYILARNNEDLSIVLTTIEQNLSTYSMKWYNSYLHETYNFVPLRNEFIELVKDGLKKREYYLLKEFNTNGGADFIDVDKKYGQEHGRAAYAYYGLMDRGILKRVTIKMQNAPLKYVGIVYASFINRNKFDKKREDLLKDIIEEVNLLTTKYVLIGDVGVPRGVIFFVPIFRNGDLEKAKERLEKLNLGISLETYVVSNIITGSFCFRKFDNIYSRQYAILTERYNLPKGYYVNYYQTGKIKKQKLKRKDIRGSEFDNLKEE